jgi:hypothetical protein
MTVEQCDRCDEVLGKYELSGQRGMVTVAGKTVWSLSTGPSLQDPLKETVHVFLCNDCQKDFWKFIDNIPFID